MLRKTFRRFVWGAVAALGLWGPAAADVVVDDFEDGNGKHVYELYWYTYQSGYTNEITITPPNGGNFAPAAGGANSSKYAGALTFDGLGSAGTYPEIGIGTHIASETVGFGSDFNNVDSISFWAKGPGGLKFYFNVHTVENAPGGGNDNKYCKLIEISSANANVWKRYSFSLKPVVAPSASELALDVIGETINWKAGDLKQSPYYGKAYTFDPAKVTSLSWTIKKDGNTATSGTLAIDDIKLIGAITPPSPPPSATTYAMTYKVNITSGGWVVVAGENPDFSWTGLVTAGASGPAVTARPSSDRYRFVKWDDGLTDSTRTDDATDDKVFTAIFEQLFSVTYKAGDNGEILVDGSPREEYTVTLAPSDNGPQVTAVGQIEPRYQFVRWSDGLTTASRSDKGIDRDTTFTAEFELYVAPPPVVRVTYTASEGGSVGAVGVSVYIDSLLAPGDSIVVNAISDSGYTFFKWSDGVSTARRVDKYENGDTLVAAIFTKKTTDPIDPELQYFTIAYSAGTGGKIKVGDNAPISLPPPLSIAADSAGPTVTAVPDSGYAFSEWSDGKTTAARTDIAKSDSMLTAKFIPTDTSIGTYKITFIAGTGGSLRINDAKVYSHFYDTTVVAGANAAVITPIADSGYTFVRWSSGSTEIPRFNINVQASVSDTAIFQQHNAVASHNREIPKAPVTEVTAISPVTIIAGELTIGPNPANVAVTFFRTGHAIKTGKLSVYDASGNLVTTVNLNDKGNSGKRAVGTWNLKDAKGRHVAIGSYAVKGTITTKNGTREKVSAIVTVTK